MAPPYNYEALDVTNAIRGKPQYMSYKDFLASRGQSYDSLYSQAPQQVAASPAGTSPINSIATEAMKNELWNAPAMQSVLGDGVASSSGANAAWNASAMGGEVLPEVGTGAAGLPILPAAAAAIGTVLAGKAGYDMLKGKRPSGIAGKAGRATLGIATGGLSEVANRLINGTKSQAQKGRDSGRKAGQEAGFIDGSYNTTLADGSKFNLGLDGGTRYKNVGTNIDGKTERQAFDVDFSNPLAKAMIPQVRQHVDKILGDGASQDQRDQLAGQFINAITSNANDQAGVDKNFASVFKTTAPTATGSKPTTPVKITGPTNVDTTGVNLRNTGSFVPQGTSPVQPAPIMIPRSSTKSPGIGLDGKPVFRRK